MKLPSKPKPPRPQRAPAQGLPAHWRRGRLIAAFAIFAVSAVLTFIGCMFDKVEQTDQLWLRARFSLRESLKPSVVPDPDIVLVDIDDRSTDKWPEPLIAWGPHFADVIDRLVDGGAKVIAMDWIQPISTTNWFPGNDAKLSAAMARAGNVVLVKELRSAGRGQPAQWIRPTPELLYSLPDSAMDPDAHLGYAELSGRDSVTVAMSLEQQVDMPGEKSATSFGARIVERYWGRHAIVQNDEWIIPGKAQVPLRDDWSVPVNFASFADSKAFQRYPIYDIARRKPGKNQEFAGKIVLIGASYQGSNDQHYIPFFNSFGSDEIFRARVIPGVLLHANLVRTLLDSRPLREPGPVATWLYAFGLSMVGLIAFSTLRWGRAALITIIGALMWMSTSLLLFMTDAILLPATLPILALLLTGFLMGGYRALGEERERAQVMKVWGRYHDPRVVEYALAHPEMRGGEGREVIATVLFADLKNFTKTVESLAPSDALTQLNRYLALISQSVLEHGGLVDKYLGDGLMAQWGVPVAHEGHAAAAVAACLDMEKRAKELARQQGEGDVSFGIRLSLHTGPVVAGNVGSEGRLEFTIIGDTVNVTARLQETAKELDCEFLVSEVTYQAVKDKVVTGKQAEVAIRGRKQALKVYEILDWREGAQNVSPADGQASKGQDGKGDATN